MRDSENHVGYVPTNHLGLGWTKAGQASENNRDAEAGAMSAPLSHNEQVIERRLADLRALDAGDAQCWENLIGILKANGKWTPADVALTLARLVSALMAVEDRVAAKD